MDQMLFGLTIFATLVFGRDNVDVIQNRIDLEDGIQDAGMVLESNPSRGNVLSGLSIFTNASRIEAQAESTPTALELQRAAAAARVAKGGMPEQPKVYDMLDMQNSPPEPKKVFDRKEKSRRIIESPSYNSLLKTFGKCKITRIMTFDHLCTLLVLPEEGVLTAHLYKNGGTSTEIAFNKHGGKSYQHGAEREGRTDNFYFFETLQGLINDARWFRTALVRDPLERALSAFHEVNVRRCELSSDVHSDECSPSIADLVTFFEELLVKLDRTNDPSKATKPGGFHFLTQTHFLINSSGVKYPFDYIGHADNLQEELRFIAHMPNLTLTRANGPDHDKGLIQKVPRLKQSDLPTSLTQLICDIYRDDYCCFGYAFPKACQTAHLQTPDCATPEGKGLNFSAGEEQELIEDESALRGEEP